MASKPNLGANRRRKLVTSPDHNSYLVSMRIRPGETQLVGGWETVNGAVCADAVTKRIEELKRTYLNKIAVSKDGWETLYQDPADLRFWELRYAQGDWHGGGPATLK